MQGSALGGRARKVFPPDFGEEKVFEGLASLSRFCARVLCPKAADPQNGPDNEYSGRQEQENSNQWKTERRRLCSIKKNSCEGVLAVFG